MTDDASGEIAERPCPRGRLRDAYPVHERDVELLAPDHLSGIRLTAALARHADGLLQDARRRRVVYAPPAGDGERIAAAEAAGFRYVLDVDVPGDELSLLVAEPGWVTAVDADLDRVPGS